MKRLIASEFVPPNGPTEAPVRPHFPYRGDGMGEYGPDEPGFVTDA